MTLLGPHKRRLHNVVPDLAYVMKYTEQVPDRGNHWFWKTGRRNHGHDARGQAYVRWVLKKPTADSGYFTHGEFNVARLLITHRGGPIPPRAQVVNICGLSQCINPEHWQRLLPQPKWRMRVDDDGTWELVATGTARPARREVVVHLRHVDGIHLASIAPLDQRRGTPLRTACGVVLHPADTMVTAMPVSCGRCV